MKIRINKERIKELGPCTRGYENFLKHHSHFDGDITEFLELHSISASDKIWVCVRLMPRFLVEVFAIDCAVRSASYAVAYSSYAAAAAAASYAASAFAASLAAYASAEERERQLHAIAYLVSTYKEGEV